LQAEWDKPYLTPLLQLALLGHKLSEQSDEKLTPLRRELTRLAHVQLLEQMKKIDEPDDDKAAELWRSTLLEYFLSSSRSQPEDAISHATAALRQSTVEDIAFLISEEKLFKAAAAKFKELPGKDGPEPTPS
jgi:hypothetical protein